MFLLRKMPQGLGFSSFGGVGVLNSFFAQGVGNSPIKKIAGGSCPGGDGQAWN